MRRPGSRPGPLEKNVKKIDILDLVKNPTNNVSLASIEAERGSGAPGSNATVVKIRATVVIEATVTEGPDNFSSCGCCGARPGPPDLQNQDVVAFLLAHHDGNRFVYGAEEDCQAERDCYPVRGWVQGWDGSEVSGGLLCPDCVEVANQALKSRRR